MISRSTFQQQPVRAEQYCSLVQRSTSTHCLVRLVTAFRHCIARVALLLSWMDALNLRTDAPLISDPLIHDLIAMFNKNVFA